MTELTLRTAVDLRRLIETGEVSAVEVLEAHLERIRRVDQQTHAFLRVLDEQARAHARDIDDRRAAGEAVGALAGVPLALKDVLCTKDIETTCASRILEDYRPAYDATAVRRLRDADAVVVGKTNMDEFAMGSSTENSGFGVTRNPWDLRRVPGGSSGGSAAAVAASQAPLAIGTDTGGSVRQPASLCGVVGMKPTYGMVSRYGLIAFASSLDQVGPLARTVGDAAHLFAAVAGHDPCDTTSIPVGAPDVLGSLEAGVEGMRIGVVQQFMGDGVEAGVQARVNEAIAVLDKLGAEIVDVTLPHADYAVNAYYLIAPSECSSNLARYDGVRYGLRIDGGTAEEMMAQTRAKGFGPEVKRRVMIGAYALSAGYYDAYYAQAQRIRTFIIRDFQEAYKQCDVLVSPTSPTTAFELGARVDDPLAMYLSDVFTVPASLSGDPALSLPVGCDDAGLPVGLQVMAPSLGEATLFRVARAVESEIGFDPTPTGPHAIESPAAAGKEPS